MEFSLKEVISYVDKLSLPEPEEGEAYQTDIPTLDKEFFSIPLEQYLTGRNSKFDLFLKLSHDKFVKVLHKGDSFDLNFLNNLETRGVSVLYINRSKLSEYLVIQERILMAIVRDYEASLRFKSHVICGQGSQIFTSFQELQDSQCLSNMDLFIPSIQNLVEEYRIKFKTSFAEFLFADTTGYHHSIFSVILGIIIAKEQKILSQGPLRTIVVASMFHDVSIMEHERIDKTNDLETYQKHPLESESILSKHKFFDTAVLQAVRQHHMRVRGLTFPALAKSEVINQISQIVGLADEISYSLKKVMIKFDPKKMKLLESYLEDQVFLNFGRMYVDSARQMIFNRKKK